MRKRGGKTQPLKRDRAAGCLRERILPVLAGAGLGLAAIWLCYRSLLALPVAALICLLYVRQARREAEEKKKRILNAHFRDFLSALHSAMKAGQSPENAVRSAAADIEQLYGAGDILSEKLREIRRQMSFSRPVETLFWELGKESGVEDIRNFGEVLLIAKRTGGELSRVLETAWRTSSEKLETEREIAALISAKQYEQKVLSLMPVAILFYMRLAFPDLLEKLYGSVTGVAVMSACLVAYLAAMTLAKRIARIEV